MSISACALVPFGVKSLARRAVKGPPNRLFDSRGTPIWNILQSEAARSWTKSTSLCRGRLVLGSSSSLVSRACSSSIYSTRCARISSRDGKNTLKSISISCRARRPNGNRAAQQKPLAQKLSRKQRIQAGHLRASRYALESARASRVGTQTSFRVPHAKSLSSAVRAIASSRHAQNGDIFFIKHGADPLNEVGVMPFGGMVLEPIGY